MKVKHKRLDPCKMHKIRIDDHITKSFQTTQNTQTLESPRNFTQKTKGSMP